MLASLTPPTSGENDLIEGPLLGGYMVLNEGTGSMTMSGRACGINVADLPDEEMNRVYYYSVFPNMLLSLHPDYVMFHTLWPIDERHTRILCDWLFHPDSLNNHEIQSGRRDRVLGHDQSAGLAHLRAEPARCGVAVLRSRTLLRSRMPLRTVRP